MKKLLTYLTLIGIFLFSSSFGVADNNGYVRKKKAELVNVKADSLQAEYTFSPNLTVTKSSYQKVVSRAMLADKETIGVLQWVVISLYTVSKWAAGFVIKILISLY